MIVVIALFFIPVRAAAQPSATPPEILEKAEQTQKIKAELED